MRRWLVCKMPFNHMPESFPVCDTADNQGGSQNIRTGDLSSRQGSKSLPKSNF